MAKTLAGMGFEVIRGIDLDQQGMQETLRRFVTAMAEAKVALFYYAGHGIQVGGKNYLIPVDANLTDQASLDFDTIDADKIFAYMGNNGRVALAFLDACRDNPFTRSLPRTIGATRGLIYSGLAAPETAGSGLFIGFATAPNDVAGDGVGEHSPFTTAMLKYLATPGLEINQLMTRVKAEVRAATNGEQRPWSNSDLDVDVYLVPPLSLADQLQPKTPASPDNVTIVAKTAGHDPKLQRSVRVVTVSENGPLNDILLRNGFDEQTFEIVSATLRLVLNSANMPQGAVLRILMGPSRTSDTLIPFQLSIYFPDTRTGEIKHAATVALTDRGNYVLGLEPEPINLPDGAIVGSKAPIVRINPDDGRVDRPRAPLF